MKYIFLVTIILTSTIAFARGPFSSRDNSQRSNETNASASWYCTASCYYEWGIGGTIFGGEGYRGVSGSGSTRGEAFSKMAGKCDPEHLWAINDSGTNADRFNSCDSR